MEKISIKKKEIERVINTLTDSYWVFDGEKFNSSEFNPLISVLISIISFLLFHVFVSRVYILILPAILLLPLIIALRILDRYKFDRKTTIKILKSWLEDSVIESTK